jgi:5-methyltetrahydrofolate--homocysteine methyltransferase
MAIAAGMPCAITNPLEVEIMTAIRAADLLMGVDENCMAWLTMQRRLAQQQAAAADATAPTPATTESSSRRLGRRERLLGSRGE